MPRYVIEPHSLVQDRYRLDAPLGRGGMAEVWRATDERLQRRVAIKFLTARYAEDPEFLVRFFSEAQTIAGITHLNVIRVLDFGRTDEAPYLVMELVEGGSLAEAMPSDIATAIGVVAQAAEGAGAAHARGVVHRDIKPGNILLATDGTAKLADFGIATNGAADRLTATGTAIGSPHYISPEGVQGAGGTPASDVYSLGVVLYEALTGRRPFEAEGPTSIAIAHVDREPVPPRAHRPELPVWVNAIVLTCLAKDPRARFADGAELARALRAGSVPVAPATTGTVHSARRRKTSLLIGAAAAAVLALGGWFLAAPDAPVADASDPGAARPRVAPTEVADDTSAAETTSDPTGVVASPSATTDPSSPSQTDTQPASQDAPEPDEVAANAPAQQQAGEQQPADQTEEEPEEQPEEEPEPQPSEEPEPTPAPEETSEPSEPEATPQP